MIYWKRTNYFQDLQWLANWLVALHTVISWKQYLIWDWESCIKNKKNWWVVMLRFKGISRYTVIEQYLCLDMEHKNKYDF